jgi:hypothetical protein
MPAGPVRVSIPAPLAGAGQSVTSQFPTFHSGHQTPHEWARAATFCAQGDDGADSEGNEPLREHYLIESW